jgi:hypothetical protein
MNREAHGRNERNRAQMGPNERGQSWGWNVRRKNSDTHTIRSKSYPQRFTFTYLIANTGARLVFDSQHGHSCDLRDRPADIYFYTQSRFYVLSSPVYRIIEVIELVDRRPIKTAQKPV